MRLCQHSVVLVATEMIEVELWVLRLISKEM